MIQKAWPNITYSSDAFRDYYLALVHNSWAYKKKQKKHSRSFTLEEEPLGAFCINIIKHFENKFGNQMSVENGLFKAWDPTYRASSSAFDDMYNDSISLSTIFHIFFTNFIKIFDVNCGLMHKLWPSPSNKCNLTAHITRGKDKEENHC